MADVLEVMAERICIGAGLNERLAVKPARHIIPKLPGLNYPAQITRTKLPGPNYPDRALVAAFLTINQILLCAICG